MAEEGAGGTSRRGFPVGAGAAGLAGVALSRAVWPTPALAQASTGAGGGASGIDLTLDGAAAGRLSSADGGTAVGTVVTEKLGGDFIAKRHIAGVKYEDISVTCGTGMSKAIYDWIKASFDGRFERHAGAVRALNAKGAGTSLSFTNALLSEVGMPALDAGSKDAAKMTLKFAPEVTRFKAASGLAASPPKKQKQWLPSNFRLDIPGLDCTKVSKVDAITIKQTVARDDVGELRDVTKEPAKLEIPNLKIELSMASADTWFAWHEDFVVKGNNGDDKELSGSLAYLAPDNSPLFVLTFKRLGIFKVAPDKMEAGAEGIRRVKAEMYCENISFSYGDAAWA